MRFEVDRVLIGSEAVIVLRIRPNEGKDTVVELKPMQASVLSSLLLVAAHENKLFSGSMQL